MAIELRLGYCLSCPALLKVLHVVLSLVILGLILAQHHGTGTRFVLRGEYFTVLVCFFVIICSILFLFVAFFNCHEGTAVCGCRCSRLINAYYLLCFCLFMFAGGVEAYYAWYRFESYDGSKRSLFHSMYIRRAFAATFCFVNAVLFLLSWWQGQVKDI